MKRIIPAACAAMLICTPADAGGRVIPTIPASYVFPNAVAPATRIATQIGAGKEILAAMTVTGILCFAKIFICKDKDRAATATTPPAAAVPLPAGGILLGGVVVAGGIAMRRRRSDRGPKFDRGTRLHPDELADIRAERMKG